MQKRIIFSKFALAKGKQPIIKLMAADLDGKVP